jgi:MinD-like ATPase involved in chromosome partitioning or flagellar assembly
MAKLPYGIVVASQKGGVGKTTISVNLAVALSMKGYSVLLIDADYVNPSVSYHFGMDDVDVGFIDVLNGVAPLASAVKMVVGGGLSLLMGTNKGASIQFSADQFERLFDQISNTNYDFVIFDMAPGQEPREAFDMFSRWGTLEFLLPIIPEFSSCVSAIRLARICDSMHIGRKFVANREKNKEYQLSIREMEEACGEKLLAVVPEDDVVPKSTVTHKPACILDPNSAFSKVVIDFSGYYSLKVGHSVGGEVAQQKPGFLQSLIARILNFFRRK